MGTWWGFPSPDRFSGSPTLITVLRVQVQRWGRGGERGEGEGELAPEACKLRPLVRPPNGLRDSELGPGFKSLGAPDLAQYGIYFLFI